MSNRGVQWKIALGAGLVYALVVGLMTLPAPLQLSHRLLGHGSDPWIFYWNNWWLQRAISEKLDWFSTPYLFYPQGASLVAHSNSFLNSLLAIPLESLLGPVAAYNLVLLFGLWVSGIGMFLLVQEVTRCSPAALLAGFIFAFTPYHLTQALAHAHLGSIHWWPFYVLLLRRALRSYRVIDALKAGLFAALNLWSGIQLAVLLALWTALYLGWHLWREVNSHTGFGRRCLRILGVAGLVGIVTLMLGAPLILPVTRDWRQMVDAAATFDGGVSRQTDLLAYLLPPSYHPLAGSHVLPIYERFETNKMHMPYLGYTVLGLALISLPSWRKAPLPPGDYGGREARFWLLSAGFWMLLAAGSAPRLNGAVYHNIPLPYRLVRHLFPISAIRAPDRFNLLTAFSLAMSAGLGAARLTKQRHWLLVPLALLTLVEYLCVPIPMLDLPAGSPFFEQMVQEEAVDANYSVVDYPMGYTAGKRWLYYQTLHGKPLVEGHISRYTLKDYAFIASQPLLRTFYQIAEKPHYLASEDTLSGQALPISALGPALHSLGNSGVRYILLHKPYLDATHRDHFRRALPIIVPIYEDATLTVYDTAHPLPVGYDGLPVPLTPDVALARFDVQQDTQWRLQVVAVPLARRDSPLDCQIQLTREAGDALSLPITLFEDSTETTWDERVLEITEITTSLPQTLEPGAYHWAMTCPGGTVYTAPETLERHTDGRITYLRRRVDIRYGDAIKLAGYRWRTLGPELQITLQWEALENPHVNYKVFTHLLNATGEIVAQYDAIPCNWQCPTSQWQAGDKLSDQATLPLGTLPPGKYRLAVGLYVEETLERLAAQGPEGERHPDGYFLLSDPFLISRW